MPACDILIRGKADVEKAVDVVYFAVLLAVEVDAVGGHRDFGPAEDGWLHPRRVFDRDVNHTKMR